MEAFHLHLVTTTHGEAVYSTVRAELLTVILTMMRVIWRELRKVRVDSETSYVSEDKDVIVGKYLWVTYKPI